MAELSRYTLVFSYGYKTVFYNTLFNSAISIDSNFITERNFVKDKLIIDSLSPEVLDFLTNNRMISNVAEEENSLTKKINLNFGTDSKIFYACLFTTMKCNLKCPYCYETHSNLQLESRVYNELFSYIKKSDHKLIRLSWFGGEPLMAYDNIIGFSDRLIDLSIKKPFKYAGIITSNGTLLTRDRFIELNKRNIYNFQITIDGDKLDNDKTRIFKDGSGSFDIIVKNLLDIKNTDLAFSIIIRCNVSCTTNINNFLDFFENNFGEDKRFFVLLFPVSNWKPKDGNLCDSLNKSRSLYDLNTFVLKRKLNSFFYYSLIHHDLFCDFGYKDKIVINPNGFINNCTITYLDGEVPLTTKNIERYDSNEFLCTNKSCFLYPKCFGRICRKSTIDDEYCSDLRFSFSESLRMYFNEYNK